MGVETEVRSAWAAFAEKARAAEAAGFVVIIPRRLADAVALSATAKAVSAEAPAASVDAADEVIHISPPIHSDPGDENPEPPTRTTRRFNR